ncbi:hypothetical protein GQ457_11G032970 [Hibiscus cannabinus]
MNTEDRLSTLEANHKNTQDRLDKIEKDLKDEITQAQKSTVSQIAAMLGFKDPDKGKTIEAVDILTQQPGITYAHSGYQEETIPPKARVQVHLAGPSDNVSGEHEASHGDTQDPEVPNLDEIADKAKNDKKLEDKYNKLEGITKTLQGGVPDLEKYDGTTCPSTHLTMYCRKMSMHLDNEKLLIHCFQDSLTGSAARWYTQLSRVDIQTWRDLSKAFLEQYKHVTDLVPTRLVLQGIEQKHNETFRHYAQRWRDVAAQVRPPLLESEITPMFVETLKGTFYDRMINHATKVLRIWWNESDLRVGSNQPICLEEIENYDEEEDDLPSDLLRLVENEEKQILPYKEDLEVLNLGTEEERREVKIGTTITAKTRQNLIKLLQDYHDVFAWSYQDMPGLDTEIVMHRLPIKTECKPVQQKLRRMKPEMLLKIRDEGQDTPTNCRMRNRRKTPYIALGTRHHVVSAKEAIGGRHPTTLQGQDIPHPLQKKP